MLRKEAAPSVRLEKIMNPRRGHNEAKNEETWEILIKKIAGPQNGVKV